MTYRFFHAVETLEDLRAQYKKLAMQYHPDRGGSTEDFQALGAEYEELLKTVGSTRRNKDGETYTKQGYNAADDRFKDIIDRIIHYDVTIEICGCWVWVGNAYNYRKELKEAGFFWCSAKKMWAWAEDPYTTAVKISMDRIREIYGSEVVKRNGAGQRLLPETA